MRIKLIVFDLWQTLVYREGGSSTARMLEESKVKMGKEEFTKIYEQTVETRKWKSKHEAYAELCKVIGLEPAKRNVNLLMGIRDRAEESVKLFPHTIPMLRQLRKKGYKTGIISTSTAFSIEIVKKKMDLLDYIDYPIFSFDVGTAKPDLRIFEEMLKVSGCEPEEVIMIGDKPDDDVLPAKKLGMGAIHFKNYEQLKKDLESFSIHLD